ncbi:hypothetical protein [Streptomyces sp. NPDC020362]|uniref:hypothetical protein n=1 Tax=unclassified Streptomyces TaxID=2593676 RepID=UPI000AE446C6
MARSPGFVQPRGAFSAKAISLRRVAAGLLFGTVTGAAGPRRQRVPTGREDR